MGLLPMDIDILPPSDDRIFKLILTSPEEGKIVLMDLISSIINRQVVNVEVRNNELPVGDIEGKAGRLDVNCRIQDGTQISLEIQASYLKEDLGGEHKNLIGKSIYYLCDLHSSQPLKGVKRYDRLVQTYQVTFCSYNVFPKLASYVNSFSMRHDTTNELLSDIIHVIFIELSKLSEIVEKPVSEMSELEKWAIFFQYANITTHREKVNKIIESKKELQMAGDLLMSVSKDERERAINRSRRMYETDMASNLATAEDIGEQKGVIKVARNMIADGDPIDKIIRNTGLTREEVEKLDVLPPII